MIDITLKDLAAAEKRIEQSYALDHYTKQQNALTYKLCRSNPVTRSEKVEAIVFELFKKNGHNVYMMGGLKKKYDLWVNDEKIEVKSSLAKKCVTRDRKIYFTYTFPGIKPECFDRLVLAYVMPNGIKLSVLTQRAVYARISKGNLKRGPQGYALYHGRDVRAIGQEFSNFLGLVTA